MNEQELQKTLSAIPYSRRTVLLPQCLRSNTCKAPRAKYGILECQECRQLRNDGTVCPIPDMVSIAKEVGYRDIFIFTGGSGIVPFFKEHGIPEAVIAVACEIEIREGVKQMDSIGVPCQIIYLLQDGCAETWFVKEGEDPAECWRKILTRYPPADEQQD